VGVIQQKVELIMQPIQMEMVIRINSDGFTVSFLERATGKEVYVDKWEHREGECLPLKSEALADRLPEPFRFLGHVCEENDYNPLDISCEMAIYEEEGETAYHDIGDE
jgi:hypothetical protein